MQNAQSFYEMELRWVRRVRMSPNPKLSPYVKDAAHREKELLLLLKKFLPAPLLFPLPNLLLPTRQRIPLLDRQKTGSATI